MDHLQTIWPSPSWNRHHDRFRDISREVGIKWIMPESKALELPWVRERFGSPKISWPNLVARSFDTRKRTIRYWTAKSTDLMVYEQNLLRGGGLCPIEGVIPCTIETAKPTLPAYPFMLEQASRISNLGATTFSPWKALINSSILTLSEASEYQEKTRKWLSVTKSTLKDSYVYYVQWENDCDLVKIGFSSDIIGRFKTFLTCNPRCLRLLRIEKVLSNQGESLRHKQFHECRWRGEWFHLHGQLASHIKNISASPLIDLKSALADKFGDRLIIDFSLDAISG